MHHPPLIILLILNSFSLTKFNEIITCLTKKSDKKQGTIIRGFHEIRYDVIIGTMLKVGPDTFHRDHVFVPLSSFDQRIFIDKCRQKMAPLKLCEYWHHCWVCFIDTTHGKICCFNKQ